MKRRWVFLLSWKAPLPGSIEPRASLASRKRITLPPATGVSTWNGARATAHSQAIWSSRLLLPAVPEIAVGEGEEAPLGIPPSVTVGRAGADEYRARCAQSNQLVRIDGHVVPCERAGVL